MLFAHFWQDRLGHQKGRLQIRINNLVPIAFCDVLNLLWPCDRGIVHQNVDRTHLALDPIYHLADRIRVRDIRLDNYSPAAGVADLVVNRSRRFLVGAIVDRNVCPRLCQRNHHPGTNAATPASHESKLPAEVIHETYYPLRFTTAASPRRGNACTHSESGSAPHTGDPETCSVGVRVQTNGTTRSAELAESVCLHC